MTTITPIPTKSTITDENVARYVTEKITQDSELERRLRLETLQLSAGGMISSSDVGAFLALIAKITNTTKAIEVGAFTGYTALKIASSLPANGKLICCDISPEWTQIGKKYWTEAQVDSKIDLRIAPALQTLKKLLDDGQENTFDFAFIDADKVGYADYFEVCLKLIRPKGVIILDNMLWDGAVADPKNEDATTKALRQLNAKISQDNRVDSCLLTVGDGLMMVTKK